MIPSSFKRALSLAGALLFSSTLANAQFMQNGDLILGFQATGGTGAKTNVFLNLGDPTTFRDGTNSTSFGNISGVLSDAFGSNWYEREEVRFGAIANLSDKIPQIPGAFNPALPVKGDPARTIYASRATTTAGHSHPFTGFDYQVLATPAKLISSMESIFPSLGTPGAGGTIVLREATHIEEWKNSWTIHNPEPYSYSFLLPTIEQTFGRGGEAVQIDIQRLISTTTGANPTATVGTGQYIATISISSSGAVTASRAGGSTENFESWALSNNVTGGLLGDSDKDGILNIIEYALDLNLQGSDGTPGTFADNTWTFRKRPAAVTNGDITYAIEVSDDLGITSPWTTVTATRNTDEEIAFTLPAGRARTFARLKVTSTSN